MKTKKEKKPKEKLHSNRIKSILIELNMTQSELSKLSGLSTSHLSKIILGKKRHVSLVTAFNICNALGKPIDMVFVHKKPVNTTTQGKSKNKEKEPKVIQGDTK